MDVKAFEADSQTAENGTLLFHGVEGSSYLPSGTISGAQMNVFVDKDSYKQGEDAVVCAVPPEYSTSVVASANSGTWFHIKLPFEIPIFNTRTLNGANIWFILVAIVGGIGMTRVKKVIMKK